MSARSAGTFKEVEFQKNYDNYQRMNIGCCGELATDSHTLDTFYSHFVLTA